MVKLSVVIITFNEEKNIGRCLDSVVTIADEILVVDSYSTDNTQLICEKYGVRFIQNKFQGHIQQKNFAAQQSAYNHVLSLDADEVLSTTLIESIKKVKINFNADGFIVNRLNNYCGQWVKHGGWYPDYKLRLWDKRLGAWGGENPHDKFIMNANKKIQNLEGDLLHYTFHTIDDHIAQAVKFAHIGAADAFKQGRTAGILKITLYPFWRFLRDYIFRAGFLDGYYGFVIAAISANSNFIKYIKLRELNRSKI